MSRHNLTWPGGTSSRPAPCWAAGTGGTGPSHDARPYDGAWDGIRLLDDPAGRPVRPRQADVEDPFAAVDLRFRPVRD